MTALLRTAGLHCAYGADEIIHGVDLEIAPGEIVTILGGLFYHAQGRDVRGDFSHWYDQLTWKDLWIFGRASAELALLEKVAGAACAVVDELRGKLAGCSAEGGVLVDESGAVTIGRLRDFVSERVHARVLRSSDGFILSSNADAGVPHHQGDDAHVLAPGDVLLFDFFPRGAGGYHHDITRTWCLGPPRPEVEREEPSAKVPVGPVDPVAPDPGLRAGPDHGQGDGRGSG